MMEVFVIAKDPDSIIVVTAELFARAEIQTDLSTDHAFGKLAFKTHTEAQAFIEKITHKQMTELNKHKESFQKISDTLSPVDKLLDNKNKEIEILERAIRHGEEEMSYFLACKVFKIDINISSASESVPL